MNRMFVLGLLAVVLTGCGTVVPPGKRVILLHPSGETEIFDRGVYHAWGRTKVYFVDQKLKSYNEEMEILCADDISMAVDVKTLLSFNVSDKSIGFIKEKVPAVDSQDEAGRELSLDSFYEMTVRDIVRSSARNIIGDLVTDDIRANRERLEAEIQAAVVNRVAQLKYPLDVSAVLISRTEYPKSVIAMREKIKQAQLADQERAAIAEAELAEAQRRVAVEQELAKVRMVKAQAQADENKILGESLTPEFLLWHQMESLELISDKFAKGPNNTVFMLPYDALTSEVKDTAMLRDAIQQRKSK